MSDLLAQGGKRYFLITLGWLSLVCGVIGIFLPLLPTTPLVLLAAWCFSRSSQRFYHWLLHQRQLGPIVQAWESGAGIPRRVRNRVIALLWLSLICSSIIMGAMGYWWPSPILALLGAVATAYLLRQPILEDGAVVDPVIDPVVARENDLSGKE